eukprot:TRINITY_DN16035_c0_g1_i1.p1 TRINITY_DN16035_c0_g1~~TRINITY_DN16035_c0_g1_i1.p1  ORF type:complete len:204 (-),score=44.91 TRINITY_DN16035_c0_g1_i1:138-749(-)
MCVMEGCKLDFVLGIPISDAARTVTLVARITRQNGVGMMELALPRGGECKVDSNYCAGSYEGGLCGGPRERKCCKEASHGKVYERCELARELVDLHGFDFGTLGNWVCLAQHESSYNTAATNDNTNGSRDYGIFQINDNYWCDANVGAGADCGMTCNSFLDSVLADDVTCAKIIYNRHGFEAWYGWINHCKNTNVEDYVNDCF